MYGFVCLMPQAQDNRCPKIRVRQNVDHQARQAQASNSTATVRDWARQGTLASSPSKSIRQSAIHARAPVQCGTHKLQQASGRVTSARTSSPATPKQQVRSLITYTLHGHYAMPIRSMLLASGTGRPSHEDKIYVASSHHQPTLSCCAQ